MSRVIVDGGIISFVIFLFGIIFRQNSNLKKDIKADSVGKSEYDGHKKLCGAEFVHIKSGISNMSNTLGEVRDIAILLKDRAEERRKGDLPG